MSSEQMICSPSVCGLCEKLAGVYDLDQTFKVLAESIAETVDGVQACTIHRLNRKEMTLEIAAASGFDYSAADRKPTAVADCPGDRRVLDGEAVVTDDIGADRDRFSLTGAELEAGRAMLSIPLTVHGRASGVVRLFTDRARIFTAEEIDRVRGIASLGSILADRVGIWQQMRVLIDVSRSLTSSLSLEDVLDKIVYNASEIFGFTAASIRLLDQDMARLEIKATHGLSRGYLEKGPVRVEKSPVDQECLAGEIVTIDDVSADGRLQYPEEMAEEGIGALISLPLRVKGKVFGILRVYNSRPYRFGEAETDFLAALASQGAVALENARLYEHVKNEYEELTRDVWKWYDWGKNFPKL